MQKSRLIICLIFWITFNISESFAQKLSLTGSSTIRLEYQNPKSGLPVTAEIIHSFPMDNYSQVNDTLSASKPVLWLSCPVNVSQEGFVTVGDQKLHLFLIPSDTIFIKIDGSKPGPACLIEGKNKQIQQYYLAKSAKFPVTLGQQIMNAGTGDLDLISFKKLANSLYVLDRAFLQTYESKRLLPSWFVRFESDAIQYQNAYLRLYIPGYRKQVGTSPGKVPEDYFYFLDSLQIRNVTALYDCAYLDFLSEYFKYKSINAGQNKQKSSTISADYETAKLLLGKQIGEFYTIFSISGGLNNNPEQVKTDLSKLVFSKSSDYLIAYLKQEASKRINILKAGKNSPNFFLEDTRDSLVSLSQFKGQVVYLSFWFAGCKGCIHEFPFENEMVKKFASSPVKIISICTRTTKEKWLEKIDSFGLKTINLYANPSWGNKLEEKFGINVYPQYVLIGPDGNIIENFASRPSNGASGKIEKALTAMKNE